MTSGEYKCSRSVSLADCYVIAGAKHSQAAALFARHETELDEEIRKTPFDVPVIFLEDIKA